MKIKFQIIMWMFTTFTYVTKANVTELNSETLRKIDYTKKEATVLIFMSKDCPCSNRNLNYVNELKKQFNQFQFIGIHANKKVSNSSLENYLNEKKLDFDVYNDSSFILTNKYEAVKTPHVFIVGKMGDVLYNGGVSNSTFPENATEYYLKNALDELKNGKKISKNQTKALGCYIAR